MNYLHVTCNWYHMPCYIQMMLYTCCPGCLHPIVYFHHGSASRLQHAPTAHMTQIKACSHSLDKPRLQHAPTARWPDYSMLPQPGYTRITACSHSLDTPGLQHTPTAGWPRLQHAPTAQIHPDYSIHPQPGWPRLQHAAESTKTGS